MYRWKGPKANMFEWNQSNSICKSIINDEQAGRGEMENLQGDDRFPPEIRDKMPGECPDEFPESGISDKDTKAIKQETKQEPTLYKISNASGNMETTKVKQGTELEMSLLDSNDCFVLDCGQANKGGEIFIWKGENSNVDERKQCMKSAIKFVAEKGYGKSCAITVYMQGRETEFFQQHFDWIEM